MWTNIDSTTQRTDNKLHLKDLFPSMTVCVGWDPGQDESSDPDDFPMPPAEPKAPDTEQPCDPSSN